MLKHIKGNSYYFEGRINIGVYIKDGKATLVDSGIDDDYARKVVNALNEKNIVISAIINTHSHGDHYGGNNLIKERTGCRIYAPEKEAILIENPIFEPLYLFGADPIDELKDKFFMNKPSRPDEIITGDKNGDLKIICVPGHSINMIAVATPDNIVYACDAFFPESVLAKYKIPYLFNVKDTLSSLENLKVSDYDFFLATHGGLIAKDVAKKDIQANINKIKEVVLEIEKILEEKKTIDEVHKYISVKYDLYVTVTQYFLNLSIIKAYLSYLKKENRIVCFIEGKELYWEKI
jgi:glyoxylase-like metal-dependent hydrolase (beta-lactamase superfamily II)